MDDSPTSARVRLQLEQLEDRSCPSGTVLWNTFLGGTSWDQGKAVAVDGAGNVYVAGLTASANFPATAGAFDQSPRSIFVSKFTPTGVLAWSTFLGGSATGSISTGAGQSPDVAGIVVDAAGAVYVVGNTRSPDFPTTVGAYDTTYNPGGDDGGSDVFIAKLNADGNALLYSTFLGGSDWDFASALALDAEGNVYVGGTTSSLDFPNGDGSRGGFVAKLNSTGTNLTYSRVFNEAEEIHALAVDSDGAVFFDSYDSSGPPGAYDPKLFINKLDTQSNSILWSTFLGRGVAQGVSVGANGEAHVVGHTWGSNIATTPNALKREYGGDNTGWVGDGFLIALSGDGATVEYATYLGGQATDAAWGVATTAGAIYVTGHTWSTDFLPPPGNSQIGVFVLKFAASTHEFAGAVFLDGSDHEVGLGLALDASRSVFVTGFTASSDFPVTTGAYDTTFNGGEDVFVARLRFSGDGIPGDKAGPRVLSITPAGYYAGGIDHLDISFNEEIDPNSFTAGDVTLLNPKAAPIALSSSPTSLDSAKTVFRIAFAKQTQLGRYVVRLGPDIVDTAGNLMDQDGDGLAGEVIQDRFEGIVEIVRTPVIIVPGIMGSFVPRPPTPREMVNFVNNPEPYHPSRLESMWGLPGLPYRSLIWRFRLTGYQYYDIDDPSRRDTAATGPKSDLFFAAYDWRQPTLLDPVNPATRLWDDNRDTFQSAVEYFDWWVQVARAKWIERYGDALGFAVDVIAHSMGGLVARAYIQEAENAGQTAERVNNLVMLGVPNHGAVATYRFWDPRRNVVGWDFWNLGITDWYLRLALKTALDQNPGKHASDLIKSLRDLMPTFPFLMVPGSGGLSGMNVNYLLPQLNSSIPTLTQKTNVILIGSIGTYSLQTPTRVEILDDGRMRFHTQPGGDGRVMYDKIPGLADFAGLILEQGPFTAYFVSSIRHNNLPSAVAVWSLLRTHLVMR